MLRVRGRSDELNGLGEQRYVLLRWMVIFEDKSEGEHVWQRLQEVKWGQPTVSSDDLSCVLSFSKKT